MDKKQTQMTDYELELLINEVEGTQMLEAPKRLKDEESQHTDTDCQTGD